MNKIIIVMGTPGAGKTSILNTLTDTYKVISMGTEVLKLASKMGITDRDDLTERLDPNALKKIRESVLRHINKEPGSIIIDTHATLKKGTMYLPGFSVTELKALRGLKALVYIDAAADEILIRRLKDKTRDRDVESMEEINQHRDFNISLIAGLIATLNIPFYIIENHQATLDLTIAQMEKIANDTFQ